MVAAYSTPLATELGEPGRSGYSHSLVRVSVQQLRHDTLPHIRFTLLPTPWWCKLPAKHIAGAWRAAAVDWVLGGGKRTGLGSQADQPQLLRAGTHLFGQHGGGIALGAWELGYVKEEKPWHRSKRKQ